MPANHRPHQTQSGKQHRPSPGLRHSGCRSVGHRRIATPRGIAHANNLPRFGTLDRVARYVKRIRELSEAAGGEVSTSPDDWPGYSEIVLAAKFTGSKFWFGADIEKDRNVAVDDPLVAGTRRTGGRPKPGNIGITGPNPGPVQGKRRLKRAQGADHGNYRKRAQRLSSPGLFVPAFIPIILKTMAAERSRKYGVFLGGFVGIPIMFPPGETGK